MFRSSCNFLLIIAIICCSPSLLKVSDLNFYTDQIFVESRMPAATPAQVAEKALRSPFFDKRFGEYLQVMGFGGIDTAAKGEKRFAKVEVAINSGANYGIVAHNRALLSKNSCFKDLAIKFYSEIKTEEKKSLPTLQSKLAGGKRPSLADICSSNTNCEPGFLWRKAMAFAGNDKALAISLIGICGHDDASTENFCPDSNSKIYLPGSLGAKYDLSSRLKAQIQQIQAPNKGAAYLPAKYYHVLGGAFASCLLTRRGVPGFVARMVQTKGISAYRARHLCHERGIRRVIAPEKQMIVDDAVLILKGMPNAAIIFDCSQLDIENANYMALKNVTKSNCPPSMDKRRCANAVAKIKTWLVDFDWSIAQHRAGVQFAEDNCPSIGVNTDPLKNSCPALNSVSTPLRSHPQEVKSAQ